MEVPRRPDYSDARYILLHEEGGNGEVRGDAFTSVINIDSEGISPAAVVGDFGSYIN